MDDHHTSNWRAMFERQRKEAHPPGGGAIRRAASADAPPPFAYDDGYTAGPQGAAALSPQQVVEEAALALADDAREYRPWILQRGGRLVSMLNLRRFEANSGGWQGWAVAYSHLVAAEYVGDGLVSLDFGSRHFMIEGSGLNELIDHLQGGSVVCVQEFAPGIWAKRPDGAAISSIRLLTQQNE